MTRQQPLASFAAVGALAALVIGAQNGIAQPGLRERAPIVTVQGAIAPTIVQRGAMATLTLNFTVREGYHINAVKPGNPDLIAASLNVTPPSGVTIGKPRFPNSKTMTLPGMTAGTQVYEGKQTVMIPVQIAKTAKQGTQTLTANLGYQACNATSCLPPDSAKAQVTFVVR